MMGIMRRKSRVVVNHEASESYRYRMLEGQAGVVTRMPLIGNKVTVALAASNWHEVRIPRDYLDLRDEREPAWL